MTDQIDIPEQFNEVIDIFESLQNRARVYKDEVRDCNRRVRADVEEHLDKAIGLISEVGVANVDLRGVSWRLYRHIREVGQSSPFNTTIQNLRQEIKDMIYALAQLNASLSETTRSLRSFMAY